VIRATHRAFGISIVVALLVAACGDYAVELPHRYSLVKIAGGEYLISNAAGVVVVGPTVDQYKVVGPYVVGRVSRPHSDTLVGFFILDTETGAISDSLHETSWREQLAKYRIPSTVELHRPNRFQAL